MKKKRKTNKEMKQMPLREAASLNWRAVRIWWRIAPDRFLSSALYAVLNAALPYTGIWFSARIINELAGNRNMDRLLQNIWSLLIVAALLSIMRAAAERWKNAVQAGCYHKSQELYSKKFLCMDFEAMDRPSTHELYTMIRQNSFSGLGLYLIPYMFEPLLTAAAQLLGAFALTVSFFTSRVPEGKGPLTLLNHPLIGLAAAAVMVLLLFLSAFLFARADAYFAEAGSEDILFGNRSSAFYSTAVAEKERALDSRLYEQERIWDSYVHKATVFTTKGRLAVLSRGSIGWLKASSAGVSGLLIGLTYVFVGLKAYGGAFGVGMVTQYVGTITGMAEALTNIFQGLSRLRTNAEFLKPPFRFLDIPNEMYQGSLSVEKRSDRKYEIEFRDVSFKYPGSDTYALRHVSLRFEIGKKMAVVGENGSGKTTFIKLLARLYDPTEGEILLNGINIRKYNYREYLSIFSVVFQDFKLLAFSLGQNVAAGAGYDADRAKDCLAKAGFEERLLHMPEGMDTCLYKDFDSRGVEVSGGEEQKIAIARALYKDAPFIILDEPTAALDPISEAEIYTRFSELVGDKTAIYISHRLSSCRFCDEIMVFDQGSVIQQGSHETLLAEEKGKYAALWMAQAQYYQ